MVKTSRGSLTQNQANKALTMKAAGMTSREQMIHSPRAGDPTTLQASGSQ